MAFRDLLVEQAEQLGKAIGKVYADLLRLKSAGKVALGIEVSNQELKSEVDIDVAQIMATDKEALKQYFNKRRFGPQHLEMLGAYFKEAGEALINTQADKAKAYLGKALELLEVADETTQTISLIRMNDQKIIRSLLLRCDEA